METMRTWTLVPAQSQPVAAPFGRDVDAALRRIASTVRAARSAGARLVVFPESALGGYLLEPEPGTPPAPDMLPPALDPDGPEIARLVADRGRRRRLRRATPRPARRASATPRRCASRGDGVLGRHRKVHLPPAERFAYSARRRVRRLRHAGRPASGCCSATTSSSPRRRAALALDGARGHRLHVGLVGGPPPGPRATCATTGRRATSTRVDCVRAIENQVVWVSSNLTGPWGARRFLGRAKVVDPDGVVLRATGHDGGRRARADRSGDARSRRRCWTSTTSATAGRPPTASLGQRSRRAGSPAPRAGAPPTG